MTERVIAVLGFLLVVAGALMLKNDWGAPGAIAIGIGSCMLLGAGYGAGSRDRKRS